MAEGASGLGGLATVVHGDVRPVLTVIGLGQPLRSRHRLDRRRVVPVEVVPGQLRNASTLLCTPLSSIACAHRATGSVAFAASTCGDACRPRRRRRCGRDQSHHGPGFHLRRRSRRQRRRAGCVPWRIPPANTATRVSRYGPEISRRCPILHGKPSPVQGEAADIGGWFGESMVWPAPASRGGPFRCSRDAEEATMTAAIDSRPSCDPSQSGAQRLTAGVSGWRGRWVS